MIEIKNLKKIFNEKLVLDSINLEIFKGEHIVLLGPSGSGKSTLLRCMNLLEVPTSGEIWLDDKRISNIDINLYDELMNLPKAKQTLAVQELDSKFKWNLDKARVKMGMVFQHFNLFNNLNVLDNLTLAPVILKKYTKEEAVNKAINFLSQIGLKDKQNEYPSRLSGGQKQRVAIIRALMNDPEILLFDEPTSALDPEMVGEVLDLIKELANKGMTMVCVTHEMGFARDIATRAIFMENGQIIEQNNGNDFFANPKSARLINFLSKIKK
ncbi:amino acid ABC transporter ATP-binding protein [Helicobacter sp. MIT 14-3879]|uniref:amino acid ABC transporter ATP-binding protein n=1 Tax=Helicobacter sp. MIT 14-3879 TaxID=2040649 RepID=UPI000E1FAE1D|nr:amino acid ABC transporter ATP-binding protein [Helicobacter sp. MIT 14-3879]RDU63193.1 polar amino acid ABC transporter ATP-binding protein [Helicobacter sp. MIT 14-3879]